MKEPKNILQDERSASQAESVKESARRTPPEIMTALFTIITTLIAIVSAFVFVDESLHKTLDFGIHMVTLSYALVLSLLILSRRLVEENEKRRALLCFGVALLYVIFSIVMYVNITH